MIDKRSSANPPISLVPGHWASMGGTRPKGTRRAIGTNFLEALYLDFMEHGPAAIAAARDESPLGYCRIVASMLPTKVEVENTGGAMSDDDLMAIVQRAQVTVDNDGTGSERMLVPVPFPPQR